MPLQQSPVTAHTDRKLPNICMPANHHTVGNVFHREEKHTRHYHGHMLPSCPLQYQKPYCTGMRFIIPLPAGSRRKEKPKERRNRPYLPTLCKMCTPDEGHMPTHIHTLPMMGFLAGVVERNKIQPTTPRWLRG